MASQYLNKSPVTLNSPCRKTLPASAPCSNKVSMSAVSNKTPAIADCSSASWNARCTCAEARGRET
eukprot:1584692-Prymnesium_polylepis.2